MCIAIERVDNMFKERFIKAATIIKSSSVVYSLVGVFGSFARGDYKAISDIDFVMVPKGNPSRMDMATLREDLRNIGCDITFLKEKELCCPTSVFVREVKRDLIIVSGGYTQ